MATATQSGSAHIGNQARFDPRYGWALLAVLASAVVSLFVSFQAGVFLLIFLVLAWWTWLRPTDGFLLLIVLAPILPMLKITQTVGTLTLLKDAIILTLFARVFLLLLLRRTLPYRSVPVLAPLVALGLWTLFELVRGDSVVLGILRARDIGLYMILFVAVLWLPHTWKLQKERLRWFLAVLAVTMVLGVYQWFWAVDSAVLRFDPVREVWIPRLSSVLAHPSIFGQWLIAGSTLLACLALLIKNTQQRAFAAALFVVALPLIFLTYSRAVWIGFASALGALAAVWLLQQLLRAKKGAVVGSFKTLGWAGLVVVVLASAAAFRFTPAGGLLRSAFDPTYASNEERIEFFVRLVAPVSNVEAVFGRGLGDVVTQNFREVDLTAAQVTAGDTRAVQLTKNKTLVDNQYLKTFVEMGVVGLVIYGWLYWRLMRASYRLLQAADVRIRILGLWSLGFLAAFVVQAFFIDIWDIFPTNAFFWTLAALVAVYSAPGLDSRRGTGIMS